jgi:hypothetical protein
MDHERHPQNGIYHPIIGTQSVVLCLKTPRKFLVDLELSVHRLDHSLIHVIELFSYFIQLALHQLHVGLVFELFFSQSGLQLPDQVALLHVLSQNLAGIGTQVENLEDRV